MEYLSMYGLLSFPQARQALRITAPATNIRLPGYRLYSIPDSPLAGAKTDMQSSIDLSWITVTPQELKRVTDFLDGLGFTQTQYKNGMWNTYLHLWEGAVSDTPWNRDAFERNYLDTYVREIIPQFLE